MKKSLALSLVVASSFLGGCFSGGSSGGNAGNKPSIESTYPVAEVAFSAPDGFDVLNGITSDAGAARVKTYLEVDPSYSFSDLKELGFVLGEKTLFTDHIKPGSLMTVAAYNHDLGLILSDVHGFMPDNDISFNSDLNAVSTAIARGVVALDDHTPNNGLYDEVSTLALDETLDAAAVIALQLDGYSLTDAKEALPSVKSLALESDLEAESTSRDFQLLFNAQFDESVWVANSGAKIVFSGNAVGYESSGNIYSAEYSVELSGGTYFLSADFEGFGTQVIDLSQVVTGSNTITFMGEVFTR